MSGEAPALIAESPAALRRGFVQIFKKFLLLFCFARRILYHGEREQKAGGMKMKTKYFALAVALILAVALTGCSAGREENSAPMTPSSGVSGNPDSRNSAGVNTASPSASSNVGNDALNGGGAGGTNDLDNDGTPDGSAGVQGRSRGGSALDDVGDAAGDVLRGAGDIARDAGNAIGNAANDVGSAMR